MPWELRSTNLLGHSSPKPPQPFSPSLDQLRIAAKAKDEAIHRRLYPKRPQLPDQLPPKVQNELRSILRKEGVVAKAGKEQVSDKDISRLNPGQWLNDEIINFYGQLLMDRASEVEASKENRKRILQSHYFNTFFWPKLIQGYEKGRLAKWTKKVRKYFEG